jgi:hypothetical protein
MKWLGICFETQWKKLSPRRNGSFTKCVAAQRKLLIEIARVKQFRDQPGDLNSVFQFRQVTLNLSRKRRSTD